MNSSDNAKNVDSTFGRWGNYRPYALVGLPRGGTRCAPKMAIAVLSLGGKRLARAQYVVSKASREQWVAANKDLAVFHARMKPHMRRLRRARLIRNIECAPKGVIRRLRKALRWLK